MFCLAKSLAELYEELLEMNPDSKTLFKFIEKAQKRTDEQEILVEATEKLLRIAPVKAKDILWHIKNEKIKEMAGRVHMQKHSLDNLSTVMSKVPSLAEECWQILSDGINKHNWHVIYEILNWSGSGYDERMWQLLDEGKGPQSEDLWHSIIEKCPNFSDRASQKLAGYLEYKSLYDLSELLIGESLGLMAGYKWKISDIETRIKAGRLILDDQKSQDKSDQSNLRFIMVVFEWVCDLKEEAGNLALQKIKYSLENQISTYYGPELKVIICGTENKDMQKEAWDLGQRYKIFNNKLFREIAEAYLVKKTPIGKAAMSMVQRDEQSILNEI